ncbi:MAG: FAD-binding oxidoreductase [Ignisphaera sp.]|nr:FAD-binding oxidoreductase [Ignisphaera sp.]
MKVVIVGGGISGLFIAYELAKRGVKDVTVIEQSYLGSGASFRNVGCFRASFTSEEHVALMKKSIELWLGYREELGIELEQSGYLWIARRHETVESFRKLSMFHNSLGVPTKVLSADEVLEIQPGLNKNLVAGALFDPIAGRMPILKNIVKLYLRVRNLGVKFLFYTKALRLKASNYKVHAVETSRGVIDGEVFIIAAGGRGSRELLSTVGVKAPIIDETRYAVISEPYARFIRTAIIIDWDTPGAPYVTQTDHGGIIFARNIPEEPEVPIISHKMDSIGLLVKPLIELIPVLRYVNLVRSWIGYYDTTPDHHPIYGPVKPYENLFIAAGFSGHGVMMAPITGTVIADWVLNGRPSTPIAERLMLERFEKGRLIKELAVVG